MTTLPRPLLIALLGAVLLGAAFFATQMAAGAGEETVEPAPSTEAAPAGGSAPAPAAERERPELAPKALAAGRALARGKMVVVLFTQDGADDDATRQAVRALPRRSRRVAVFRDRVGNLARYGPVVAGLGISQAPSVVIADRRREARVLEGYVDPKSLRQALRDTAR